MPKQKSVKVTSDQEKANSNNFIVIMFNTKKFKSSTLKIAIGLFFCVVIYYLNNFFYVLGDTEKIPLSISVWLPLIFLILINTNMMLRINEK